jgi:ATP-dependent DNA helicase HFM1/MER3
MNSKRRRLVLIYYHFVPTKKKSPKASTGQKTNGTNAKALGTKSLSQERKKASERVRALDPIANILQLAEDVSGSKTKLKKEGQPDFEDVEIIALATELSPVPYSSLGPRAYRKLHNLHTSVQKDKEEKTIRLPKQKPTFSYTTDELPDLPFLKSKKNGDSVSDFDLVEEFPSPSTLIRRNEDVPMPESEFSETRVPIYQQALTSSSDHGDCLDGVGMVGLAKSIAPKSSTPETELSFGDGVFDFAAYHDPSESEDRLINPLMSELLKDEGVSSSPSRGQDLKATKRGRSRSPEITDLKHRRVTKTDLPQPAPRLSSVPAWVNDFDSDLIDGLKDFVDFVD